jgi:signal transduction histidine kinase
MRRRLVVSTILIVLVVLAALAVPVVVVVRDAAEGELRTRLEADAESVAEAALAARVEGRPLVEGDVTPLLTQGDGIVVVDADGVVLVDRPPAADDHPLEVTRLLPGGGRVVISADRGPLDDRVRSQVTILLGLAGLGLVAAATLAALQARRLAVPLERLAASAARVGDGDFSAAAPPPTGIPEIDDIGKALRTSATRVGEMLAAERHFTADATHQLRTGLTGISMRLELLTMHPDPEVVREAEAGLAQTEQLDETISELLAVARGRATRERAAFDLVGLVQDHVDEFAARFAAARRSLLMDVRSPVEVVGTKGLAGQVLDVLLDNALRHGAGAVTVTVDGPAVVVADEGPGITDPAHLETLFDMPDDPAAPHGRGLAIARRLAEVDGGSVDVLGGSPMRVRFGLLRA